MSETQLELQIPKMSIFVVFALKIIFQRYKLAGKVVYEPRRSPGRRCFTSREIICREMAGTWGQVHLNRPELASVGSALTSSPPDKSPTHQQGATHEILPQARDLFP